MVRLPSSVAVVALLAVLPLGLTAATVTSGEAHANSVTMAAHQRARPSTDVFGTAADSGDGLARRPVVHVRLGPLGQVREVTVIPGLRGAQVLAAGADRLVVTGGRFGHQTLVTAAGKVLGVLPRRCGTLPPRRPYRLEPVYVHCFPVARTRWVLRLVDGSRRLQLLKTGSAKVSVLDRLSVDADSGSAVFEPFSSSLVFAQSDGSRAFTRYVPDSRDVVVAKVHRAGWGVRPLCRVNQQRVALVSGPVQASEVLQLRPRSLTIVNPFTGRVLPSATIRVPTRLPVISCTHAATRLLALRWSPDERMSRVVAIDPQTGSLRVLAGLPWFHGIPVVAGPSAE